MDFLYKIIKEILVENKRNDFAKIDPDYEPTPKELVISRATAIAFARPVILHIIGAYTAYQCQKELKTFIVANGSSAQKFRLRLGGLSYIHLNLKFFVLNILKHGVDSAYVKQCAVAFGIQPSDVKLIGAVVQERGFKSLAKKSLAGLHKTDFDINAFKHVNDTFMEIYPDIYRHIRNRTYRKLRFLSMSCNIEFHDFNMELMLKALQTYNKMVPTKKSTLYVANYIRTSINNHITNMAKGGTAQKRARMVKGVADGFGGNKFEIMSISENQLYHALGLEDNLVSYENLRDSFVNSEEEHKNLSDLNYERILRKFGTTVKRRNLIELIACNEDEKFTKWLRKTKRIKDHEDNVDLNSKIGSKLYLQNVCEFLNVCESKAIKFIKHIGAQAYPDRV